ncbi:MAG TPA: ABC transporter ATP-binding protein [Acidimicrobiales bacterium]|nr:ABC transporter ATP-binding protein [Acidimicrobiales bacterium]
MVESDIRGLEAEGVSVAFGGLLALDHVSLNVTEGEVVGVIGPNGAGKTTLFNVMCGFVRPDSGRMLLNGRELRRLRPHQLPGLGVSRTMQAVGLWPGLTVRENVMTGAQVKSRSGFGHALAGLFRSADDERSLADRAMAILAELDAADVADRYPTTLPYPIQKRVALARALVSDPKLLLLDEPASGLSDADMASLGALIRQLTGRMGVLLVEHHMDLVMDVCDRLVVLDFGKVIAAGAPADVRDNPAVAAAYLGEDVDREAGGPDA